MIVHFWFLGFFTALARVLDARGWLVVERGSELRRRILFLDHCAHVLEPELVPDLLDLLQVIIRLTELNAIRTQTHSRLSLHVELRHLSLGVRPLCRVHHLRR